MNHNILQWNCQGLRNKKDELLALISTHKPLVIGLQETKLRETCTFTIPQYAVYRRQGHHNVTDHGGVALLIHKSIPHNFLPLRTELQAIAATIYLTRPITVVSIYSSRSHRLTDALMTELSQQLPSPVLLLGDFNSYHEMWGCERTLQGCDNGQHHRFPQPGSSQQRTAHQNYP